MIGTAHNRAFSRVNCRDGVLANDSLANPGCQLVIVRSSYDDRRRSAMNAVVGEIGTSAPQHRPVIADEVEALIDGLAQRLPAGGIVSGRLLAIGLVALMYGGLTLSRAVKGTALSDEVLRACRALGAAAAKGATDVGVSRQPDLVRANNGTPAPRP